SFTPWYLCSIPQRLSAVRTNCSSVVGAGRLLKKYLVGSASPAGHSAISQQRASGSWPALSRCAGRTCQAANRLTNLPLVPSRHVTRRNSLARAIAHCFTAGAWAPGRTFSGREGGRPVPRYGGTLPKLASAATTLSVLLIPTQYGQGALCRAWRNSVASP